MISLLSLILIGPAIITWFLGIFFGNTTFVFFTYHLLWISNILYACHNIRKRYVFLAFNLTFFLFVMGRTSMNYFFTGDFKLQYTQDIVMETFSIIALALISLRAFYALFEKQYDLKHTGRQLRIVGKWNNEVNTKILQKVSLFFYWTTFLFSVVYVLERVTVVQAAGYAMYYTNFVTRLPGIFAKLYTMNEICFFVFLATNPMKKKFFAPATSFLLLGVLCLGYGQRNPIALRICILMLIYLPLREQYREKNGEHWLTRKYKLGLMFGVPIAIIFLSFWGGIRVGNTAINGFSESVISFFDSQGNSTKIIAETINHWDEFPTGRIYTLGPIVEFLTNNVIYKALFGSGYYVAGFTVESALNGWNLGNTLSYLYSSHHFLNGVGLGSSYLAETFKDFGMFGVIIISAIYSMIITYFTKNYGKNIFVSSIFLMFVYRLIYAPRDLALGFVSDIFSITGLGTVVLLYIGYLVVKNRSHSMKINRSIID